jgi:hypothetical protein
MHRIHCAYLTHASDISKLWLGRAVISASTTDQKRSNLFLANAPLDRPNLFGGQAATRPSNGLFQLVRSALGWQRQELVILVSALAQSLLNFASVAAASDKFFFCARRLLANP